MNWILIAAWTLVAYSIINVFNMVFKSEGNSNGMKFFELGLITWQIILAFKLFNL